MSHALPQELMICSRGRQLVDCHRMLAHLTTQTVRIERHDERQGNRHAECRMIDAFFQSDECGHTADDCAVVAWQAAVANQAKGQLPALDAVDHEFRDPSDEPSQERRQCIGEIHDHPCVGHKDQAQAATQSTTVRSNCQSARSASVGDSPPSSSSITYQ